MEKGPRWSPQSAPGDNPSEDDPSEDDKFTFEMIQTLLMESADDDKDSESQGNLLLMMGAMKGVFAEEAPAPPVTWLRGLWDRFWEAARGGYFWFTGRPGDEISTAKRFADWFRTHLRLTAYPPLDYGLPQNWFLHPTLRPHAIADVIICDQETNFTRHAIPLTNQVEEGLQPARGEYIFHLHGTTLAEESEKHLFGTGPSLRRFDQCVEAVLSDVMNPNYPVRCFAPKYRGYNTMAIKHFESLMPLILDRDTPAARLALMRFAATTLVELRSVLQDVSASYAAFLSLVPADAKVVISGYSQGAMMLLLAQYVGLLRHGSRRPTWRLSGLFSEEILSSVNHRNTAQALKAVFSSIFVTPSPTWKGLSLAKPADRIPISLVIRRATDFTPFALKGMCVPNLSPLGERIIKEGKGDHESFAYLLWTGEEDKKNSFFTVNVSADYSRFRVNTEMKVYKDLKMEFDTLGEFSLADWGLHMIDHVVISAREARNDLPVFSRPPVSTQQLVEL